MISVLAIIHIILSIFLVILVLIQDPKGGTAGMFGGGGGSNSLFGATGAPTFLGQLTRWIAVVFAVSCIAMTIFIKPKSDSVLDGMSIPAAKTQNLDKEAPTNPETPAPEATPEQPQK
jgi:preprotein translocase subunit SecG